MSMREVILFLATFVTTIFAQVNYNEWAQKPETLVASHVVFRHGARTPDGYCFKALNITKDYFPDGIGQLTQKGKMDEYRIGEALRERYNEFLGDTFHPNLIAARSTDYDRTKASLLLCLAGLFPPKPSQKWHEHLLWQPIPITYKSVEDDMLMRYPTKCDKYRQTYLEIMQTKRVQRIIQSKQNLVNYVRKNIIDGEAVSKVFISPIEELFGIYFCLVAMEDTDFPIPEWSKHVYPDILSQMAVLEYHLKAIDDSLVQYVGGYLLRKIVTDTENWIAGTNLADARKLYLYSGHEFNVALLLLAMDIFPPKVPNYGAYVVVEVHQINGTTGFKIFYQNYQQKDPISLKVPGCERFCPINDFKQIMETRLAPPDLKC